MQNNPKRIFAILGMAVLAVTLVGCKKLYQQKPPAVNVNTNISTEVSEEDAMNAAVPYSLTAQNSSGISGTAKIFDVDGKAKVVVNLTGTPNGILMPAHIHQGTCANIGPVAFPLTDVLNGSSETYLNVPISAIFNGSARALNVHKSVTEAGVYVSCVDLAEGGTVNANTNVNANVNVNVGSNTRTVTISGENFSFSQQEIRVKKGDTVKIVFKNTGGFHDWVLDEFKARTPQIQGEATAEVTFVADKIGTFEYYCSVGQHRAMGMKGNLIVE